MLSLRHSFRGCLLGALMLAFPVTLPAAEPPVRIVASIKPLALIARDLLGESAQVDVLVPPNQSPHDYSLKPSDMTRVHSADLVIWLGPALEPFLVKALSGLDKKQVLTISSNAHEEAGERTGHQHSGDLHLWLDPQQAIVIARVVAKAVADVIPNAIPNKTAALSRLAVQYTELDRQIAEQLAPLKDRGFVVYHRGYDYLVQHYQLNQLGWVSTNPERPPGVRHMLALRERLARDPARCLLVEPGHQSGRVQQVAENLSLPLFPVDLLGAQETVNSYPALMESVAASLAACLSQTQALE